MVFDLTKNYVPESYVSSRDYRVFLRMLGVLLTVFKDNIDSFVSLYSAEDCPDGMLPLLADMVGYKYDEGFSVENNRILIKYFPYLLRNRGSEYGIKLATALSLNTSVSAGYAYSVDNIVVLYDRPTGLIRIFYPYTELINMDLIEVVRPVGTRIELVPSSISQTTEEFDLNAIVRARIKEYFDGEPTVGRTKVGFDVVSHNAKKEVDDDGK